MKEFFRKIWAWFVSRDSATPAPNFGNPDLHPIDTEKLARELDVESEAERLGTRDIPSTDAQPLTGIESKIVQVIEKARQEYANWASFRIGDLNRSIAMSDLAPDAEKVVRLDAEFELKTAPMLNEWSGMLTQLNNNIDDLNKEYTAFQKSNKLTHPARIPTDAERLFRHVALVALVLVEGGLNSVFFAQGLWGGFADGLFYAAIFAFVNIFFAYGYGRFVVPEMFHCNMLRKVLGAVLLLGALAAIGALALLIAHYRDAVSGGAAGKAAWIAWEMFRSDTFTLMDAQSVLLCGISIVFALLAAYDSLTLDDPYPGYGAITRLRDRARHDHEIELAVVLAELEALKFNALNEVNATVFRMRTQLHQLDLAIEQKVDTGTRLTNAFANVGNCLQALLGRFRTSNEVHRHTPVPNYFGTQPELRPVAQPDFSTTEDCAKYVAHQLKLHMAEAEVPRVRDNIQIIYTRIYATLMPLTST